MPHIAERGLLYFELVKVCDVRKTSAGRYRAEMCGSENYWVWLKLDSDLYIKDECCDCPYVYLRVQTYLKLLYYIGKIQAYNKLEISCRLKISSDGIIKSVYPFRLVMYTPIQFLLPCSINPRQRYPYYVL